MDKGIKLTDTVTLEPTNMKYGMNDIPGAALRRLNNDAKDQTQLKT